MKTNEIKLGKIYYIVVYDPNKKWWEILSKKIESVEPISVELTFCYYKDGGVSNDFVFDRLIDAIGKQNRLNFMNARKDRGIFYNGRIVWLKTVKYGSVKSMITEIDMDQTVPTFKLRTMPKTEFSKEFPSFVMTFKITDLNDKFTLIPYTEEQNEFCNI